LPASVAIGAAVVGVGLTAYSITQSVRQRDFFNNPISEEQANFNLGFGIGSFFGGLAGGAIAGPTAGAGSQGARAFVPALAGGGTWGEGLVIVGGTTATQAVTAGGTAAAVPGIYMMATGDPGGGGGGDEGGGGGSSSGGGNNPANNEFWDLDDAAKAVLGEGAEMGARLGPIGPVKSPDVQAALRALGYNPAEFQAVQYEAFDAKGFRTIITLFESEGGVFFGPHWSSANAP
jgi:hypothetical protein